ncbi:MAG: GNAT family N-acetyltransferase [Oscillospiraceae bacterium]
MNSMQSTLTCVIRRFNRFYTNVLGLLDRHMPDTEFSLSEARILYEIGNTEDCTAKMLVQKLKIDAGYLSRILRRFEEKGLAYRVQSKEDSRFYLINLTQKGKNTLAELNLLSDKQIEKLVENLSDFEKKKFISSISTIENYLSGNFDREVQIRHTLKPGDAGALIQMHGWLYANECGYNQVFEGYVCETFFNFLKDYDETKDRIWIAESETEIVGSIAVVWRSDQTAQLRWFILHPDFRGLGIGKALFNEALQYGKEKGYKTIFLETTDDQKTAVRMYIKAGFKKVKENENIAWGIRHTEQTYELNL